MEFDRYINDDQWYGGPRNYYNARDSHGEGSYPGSDRRYHDENPSFRRNSPPPRNDGPYSQQCYSREDLRHQLGPRNSARGGPYFRNRGRGSGPVRESHNDYRTSPPVKRDRSPGSKEAQPPVHSGSNTSNRSFSPDREKSHTHQQAQKKHKPNVSTSHTPSSTAEESAPSSASSKEKTPASVAETEEVVAASMEPKLTPEEDVKTRRSEAITAKALEIEKHYRQDCETFRTVVKMLVAKEPSLDNLLQASLDENLLEIKQRCLDDLRHFVKELDEIIAQGGDGPHHGSPNTSCTTNFKTDGGFPQQCSAYPTSSDGKQEGRKQPANTGDSAHVPLENLRQGGGKQIGNTEDSPPVPEIYRQGNLATPGHEDSTSEGTLSESTPTPAQQGSIEVLQKRLQLYRCNGEKFSDTHLLNPTVWQEITHARPGRIPERLPYLQPGSRYWELKSNSTVVSTSIPSHCKGQRKVACGVTCYIHAEGPWCEVQSQDGTRICILAAPPTDRTPLPHLEQGPAELKGREGVRRGPRSRMHSAIAPYPSKHQGIQALRD